MLTTAGWLYSLPVRRMRLVAAPLTAVVLLLAATTISGCGSMGRAREIVTGRTPVGLPTIAPVDTPDANLANHPVVAATKSSVVKIRGVAHSCRKVLEGSGFVVAPNRVMANAHEVAGADSFTVQDADGVSYDANVVSYEPNVDIAILDVPKLTAPPLTFADSPATSGTDALVLGYPVFGSYVAPPPRAFARSWNSTARTSIAPRWFPVRCTRSEAL